MPSKSQSDEKARIRREMIARRGSMTSEWRAEASRKIFDRASSLNHFADSATVSTFIGRADEVDTSPLVTRIIEMKGFAAVPRVLPECKLEFHRATAFPSGFIAGPYGILEPDPSTYSQAIPPSDLELIFVPGLAFDRRGHRLGYGKGYYDRVLSQTPSAVRVGLAFSFQVVDRLPDEPHDTPVDLIITEEEFLSPVSDETETQPYWIEARGETSRLGLTPEFAKSLEGNWLGIQLAAEGSVIRPGEIFGFITTDRATHELRAPVGFRVIAINEPALANPAVTKLSPTGVGWLLEVKTLGNSVVV